MQDVAREITDLLEPSEPLGYRLLLFGGDRYGSVIFEAKAVPFKGGLAFLVRSITNKADAKTIPQVSDLPTMFAPTEDALKFFIRRAYNLCDTDLPPYHAPIAVLIPPNETGHNREVRSGGALVNLGVEYSFEVGNHDSYQERVLRETIGALTAMQVPKGLKW